ncbi:MAG: hypothetical protein KDD51_13060 [Bdellovibrionales bacterium]|nr:hypothetical protein [Bdellovibrionales bacterium]
MKAKVYASLLATVMICSAPVPAQERESRKPPTQPRTVAPAPAPKEKTAPVEDKRAEDVRDLEKRLQALTNAIGNLQLTMVEVYCEQCPVTLKQQNRELAPYLHIAGRFSILRDGLFEARDSLQDVTTLEEARRKSILDEVARFETRLRLSEASIQALEPGDANPLYHQVEKRLEDVYAFFEGKNQKPVVHDRDTLYADVAIMWRAAQYLSRSRLSSDRVRRLANGVLQKLEDLRDSEDAAQIYSTLDQVFEQLQPNYLTVDQFGMDYSVFSNDDEEAVREAAVNLLGASELFAEHSRSWAQTEFVKRRHERLSSASAEAKADGDTAKSKVLALIFYSESKPFRPSASVVAALKDNALGYLPENYALTNADKTTSLLIMHPAFSVLRGKPGVVFINYKNPESGTYRRVVSFLSAEDWNDVGRIKAAIQQAAQVSAK